MAGTLKVVTRDGSVTTHLLLLAAVSPIIRELMATAGQEEGLTHLHLPGFCKDTFCHLLALVLKGEVQVNVW